MLDSAELRLAEPEGEIFPDGNEFGPISLDVRPEEKSRILKAVRDNCDCKWNDGTLIKPCSSLLMLRSMVKDKNILAHLLFNERTAEGLTKLEFAESPTLQW